MYNTINFLKERTRIQELELIRDKRIVLFTSVFLVIFLAVTIGLFSYQVFLGSQLSKVQDASALEQSQLRGLRGVQAAYSQNAQTLKVIRSIFSKRGNKWDAIASFYQILPVGSNINSVDFNTTKESKFEFSVESDTVFTFDTLVQSLQSTDLQKHGYSFEFGSLVRGRDGRYRMTIAVNISQGNSTTGTPKSS